MHIWRGSSIYLQAKGLVVIPYPFSEPTQARVLRAYLNLLASRSLSSRQRMSSSLTGIGEWKVSCVQALACVASGGNLVKPGKDEERQEKTTKDTVTVPGPFTFRMMLLVVSSMNSTRTWVTPPREPRRELEMLARVLGWEAIT